VWSFMSYVWIVSEDVELAEEVYIKVSFVFSSAVWLFLYRVTKFKLFYTALLYWCQPGHVTFLDWEVNYENRCGSRVTGFTQYVCWLQLHWVASVHDEKTRNVLQWHFYNVPLGGTVILQNTRPVSGDRSDRVVYTNSKAFCLLVQYSGKAGHGKNK